MVVRTRTQPSSTQRAGRIKARAPQMLEHGNRTDAGNSKEVESGLRSQVRASRLENFNNFLTGRTGKSPQSDEVVAQIDVVLYCLGIGVRTRVST